MPRKSAFLKPGKIYQGDCLELMQRIEPGSVDLVFADPPFNIGYDYDEYDDRQDDDKYLDWCTDWMQQVHRVLRADGTFWLAIGDEYAAELKVIAQRNAKFHCRSWVIWYYTFGVNCVRGFSRSHTHLFHFVKDPNEFTFNSENPLVRVKSARQLVYADGRANPKGRLPDNTWFYRPQDIPNGFMPYHDSWYFSRVAGTFKEREGFHGCQMPEQLLARILRVSSNPGDVVFDPFTGSGTTLVVAKKLGRQWFGSELSTDYSTKINHRLSKVCVGDDLEGPSDPSRSSPKTSDGRTRGRYRNGRLLPQGDEETLKGIVDAYLATSNGRSTDFMLCDAELNESFTAACKKFGLPGNAFSWNRLLLRTRKTGRLPRASKRSQRLTFEQMDSFSYASEIAMRMMEIDYNLSLDDVLCWPEVATEFDAIAQLFAPDRSSFDLRWAALSIRKRASHARKLAGKSFKDFRNKSLPSAKPIDSFCSQAYECAGVYVVQADRQQLYVGESRNVRARVERIRDSDPWAKLNSSSIRFIDCRNRRDDMHGLQAMLVDREKPLLNTQLLVSGDA